MKPFRLVWAAATVVACAVAGESPKPISWTVSRLVDALVVPSEEVGALRELEKLGVAAVPTMVGHLDDMRPLPVQDIELTNDFPGAWEGIRYYGPKVAHDALSAILNQITGLRFEFVENGASDGDRRKNTAAWRSWCVHAFPEKVGECNGE